MVDAAGLIYGSWNNRRLKRFTAGTKATSG
jgi:hypothetical protein